MRAHLFNDITASSNGVYPCTEKYFQEGRSNIFYGFSFELSKSTNAQTHQCWTKFSLGPERLEAVIYHRC